MNHCYSPPKHHQLQQQQKKPNPTRPRQVLGNHSAVELMTIKKPDFTVKPTAYSDVKMKDVITTHVELHQIKQFCADLMDSLEVPHADARDRSDAQRRQHVLRQAKKGSGMRFNTVDFVLMSAYPYGNGVQQSGVPPFQVHGGLAGPLRGDPRHRRQPRRVYGETDDEIREHPVH